MDRYINREKKIIEPRGNQMISFTATGTGDIPIYENMGSMTSNLQTYSPYRGPHQTNMQLQQTVGGMPSGIDPRYLSAYERTPAMIYGQQLPREDAPSAFIAYQGHTFVGPERIDKHYSPQTPYGSKNTPIKPTAYVPERSAPIMKNPIETKQMRNVANIKQEVDLSNEEGRVKTRSDKLKELHKIGTKVFSGPVEKILKWNRAVQDIGAVVLFEIVGKCVSVRPEHQSKVLVVRDENGPAMQVVYHEIDFLLPELTVPGMVRVIGRIKSGTCRLQAFSVRPATGDDIATLPRRAAVAAHHVAKLCKDFGPN